MREVPARLLYIDDDPGICRLVQKALARRGLEVSIAGSGDDGIGLLTQSVFDLVALDQHMPGQTGLQVLELIKQLPLPPPVIFVTGSDDSHVAVAALKAGAVDYVWKDVDGHFLELLYEASMIALDKEKLRREKEAAEQEVRTARDRAEMLLKEVNHRLANSLSIVSSFVSLQLSRIDNQEARSVLETTRARVTAIAAVHRRLYVADDVRHVELRDYLHHLIGELQDLQAGAGRKVSITLASEAISLPTDKAVSFGIVVTELLTNACKYAYPEGADGDIRVSVEACGTTGRLVVEDDGVGLREGTPAGTGLGSRIVAMMARNLNGTLDMQDKKPGLRATMTFEF